MVKMVERKKKRSKRKREITRKRRMGRRRGYGLHPEERIDSEKRQELARISCGSKL